MGKFLGYLFGVLALSLLFLNLFASLTLTDVIVNILLNSGLTLSSILIAVVGILLTIYLSKDIKKSKHGKDFRILIYILTCSIVASFVMSILALYSLSYPGCNILLILLSNLFLAIIIANIFAVIGTVYKIVK